MLLQIENPLNERIFRFYEFLDLIIIEQKITDLKSLKRTALLINIIGIILGLSTLVSQLFNEILIYLTRWV